MRVLCDHFGGTLGTTLGVVWGHFEGNRGVPGGHFGVTHGVILEVLWDYFEGTSRVTLGIDWDYFEGTLGSLWRYF